MLVKLVRREVMCCRVIQAFGMCSVVSGHVHKALCRLVLSKKNYDKLAIFLHMQGEAVHKSGASSLSAWPGGQTLSLCLCLFLWPLSHGVFPLSPAPAITASFTT